MRRKLSLATPLLFRETLAAFASGKAPSDRLSSRAHTIPEVLGHDSERFVLVNDPL